MIRAVLVFDDASFKEGEHKRDKGGKFSTTGGGGAGAQSASASSPASGEGEKGSGKYHVHYKMVSLLKDSGFTQAKGGPTADNNFHFNHPSGAKVVIHPHPEGKKSSTEYTLEKPGSEPLKGSGLALKKLLDLAVEKQNAANPPAAEPTKEKFDFGPGLEKESAAANEPPATIEKLNEVLAEEPSESDGGPDTWLPEAGYKLTNSGPLGKTFKDEDGKTINYSPKTKNWMITTPDGGTQKGNGEVALSDTLSKPPGIAPTAKSNDFAATLIDKGYNFEKAIGDKQHVSVFKKGDAKVEFDLDKDTWLVQTPGYPTKEGSGAENLADLLAGGKATEKNGEFTWKNSSKTSLAGGTSSGGTKNAAASSSSTPNLSPENATHKMLAKAAPTPDPTESSAISRYTGSAYREWNRKLRTDHKFATSDKDTKTLDAYFAKAEFPEDVVLTRKIDGQYAEILRSLAHPGAIFMEKGFSSTSTHYDAWSGDTKMVISAKKGQKGASVKDSSQHKNENEVMLPRNTMYVVKQYDPSTKTLHVELNQDHIPKG